MTRIARHLSLIGTLLVLLGTTSVHLATAQETGELTIVKFVCDGEGMPSLLVVTSAEEAATRPAGCEESDSPLVAEFQIIGAGDFVWMTTDDSGVDTDSFPPGTYQVLEQSFPQPPMLNVEVKAGKVTAIQSISYAQRIRAPQCTEALEHPVAGGSEPVANGGPLMRWSLPFPAATTWIGNVAVDGETLAYDVSSDESTALVAVDATNGKLRWCMELDWFLRGSAAAIAGTVVVVVGESGPQDRAETIAFDLKSGNELWRSEVALDGLSDQAVNEDVLVGYVFDQDGYSLAALDLATGEQRWRVAPPNMGVTESVEVTSDQVFITGFGSRDAFEHEIIALDVETGLPQWRTSLGSVSGTEGYIPTPSYSEGAVYSALWNEGSCCVVALNAETGEEIWRSEVPTMDSARPIIADGQVYVGGVQGIRALDAATGDEEWSAEPDDVLIHTAPAIVGDQVFVNIPDGTGAEGDSSLVAFASDSGDELWRINLGTQRFAAAPVTADGALFIAGAELLALEMT